MAVDVFHILDVSVPQKLFLLIPRGKKIQWPSCYQLEPLILKIPLIFELRFFKNFAFCFFCPFSCGLTSPQFSTRDYNNEYAFSFDGPCVCKCCCSQEFVVRDDEGDGLGRILKEREFLTQDYLDKITDADFFGIEFPVELEVRNKAVLLIGLFVIVS